uniref:Uncharacterized protein n=1 Tax=Quercus lobata TaxID=97700 RepID=A0A7N2R3Z8_QUELO
MVLPISDMEEAQFILYLHTEMGFAGKGKLSSELSVEARGELVRLRQNIHCLGTKISHRFQIYLVLELLVVTASQFVALLETTGNPDLINFINGGDFAVSSIVELVGLIICLHSAAKISYRSLSLAAISSRCHALVTCNPNDVSQRGISSNGGNLEAAIPAGSLPINYSESDLESIDYFPVPTIYT